MLFVGRCDECKALSKYTMQGRCIITRNIQTTALGWPIQSERANNDVAANRHTAPDLFNLAIFQSGVCQEMKDSTIMPHIEVVFRKRNFCDIAFDKPDRVSQRSQSPFCRLQSFCRKIQNGYVLIPS